MSYPVTIGNFKLLEVNYLPHTEHNPNCNIVQGKFLNEDGKPFMFTYVENLISKESSYEYYSGENYIVESKDKSHSHSYNTATLPFKYIGIAKNLVSKFDNHEWPEFVTIKLHPTGDPITNGDP